MKKTFILLTIISLLAGTSVLTKNFQVSAHEGKSQEEIHESLNAQIHEHESSDENEDNDDQDENESPEPSETPESTPTASTIPTATPTLNATSTPTGSPVASSTPSPSAVASATPSVSPTPTASPLVLGANVNGSLLETISNLLKQLINLLQGQSQKD